MTAPGNLTAIDLEMFKRLGVQPDLLARAGVVRVTDSECRDRFGISGSGDRAGIVYPYFSRHDGHRVTARLRRDNPEIEDGRPKNKYLCPYGDKRHLYFVPGTILSGDSTVVLVEAEKSVLALTAWAERNRVNIVAVGMGGCWAWRGRIGKAESGNGQRVDEYGPLPDLEVCRGRQVIVMLDSNISTNPDVRRGQRELVAALIAMDSKVRVATVPAAVGINGPDDLLAVRGDGALRLVLDGAKPTVDYAGTGAEEAIRLVEGDKHNTDLLRDALDAIAAIPDKLKRQTVESRLSAVLRGVISKSTIADEVRDNRARQKEKEDAQKREMEKLDLLAKPVDAAKLVADLEKFFADRAYLPEGAALMLAYFVLNSYTFDLFDTTPYLSLESAVPGCGKSTVLGLLAALCPRARKATSLSEAALFRLLDAEKPVLLIDEAKVLEGNSERGELLRAVLHEGYKTGGQVPRCEGEDHEIRWFDVYSPKAIAEIGGLSGALLDRCIVIHMEKAPKTYKKKSTRIRALKRDSAPLGEHLKAYALQAMVKLGELYANEPDDGYWPWIRDREAELYGPLLIHAKLIGRSAELRLVSVVEKFTDAKAEIQSEDWNTAKAIAVLEALNEVTGDEFRPGDLIDSLAGSDVWSLAFGKVKGADDKTRRTAMAAKIGYFLKSFRLKGTRIGGTVRYNLKTAIDTFRSHVPEKPPNPPNPPEAKCPASQLAENTNQQDSQDTQDTFADGSENIDSGPKKHPGGDGWELFL